MCRLLAFWGENLASQAGNVLRKFQELAVCGQVPQGFPAGHQDGWGMAAFENEKILLHRRKPVNAAEDDDYLQTTNDIEKLNANLIITHLRKSSVGNRAMVNTHPFLRDRFIFCHNGSISKSETISLLPRYAQMRRGSTDSERFFLYLLQLAREKNIRSAIGEAIDFVDKNFDYTALNFLLSNGETLWAVREVNENNKFVKRYNLLDYYSLYVGRMNGNFALVCSEPLMLPNVEWDRLPNHRFVEVKVSAGKEVVYENRNNCCYSR